MHGCGEWTLCTKDRICDKCHVQSKNRSGYCVTFANVSISLNIFAIIWTMGVLCGWEIRLSLTIACHQTLHIEQCGKKHLGLMKPLSRVCSRHFVNGDHRYGLLNIIISFPISIMIFLLTGAGKGVCVYTWCGFKMWPAVAWQLQGCHSCYSCVWALTVDFRKGHTHLVCFDWCSSTGFRFGRSSLYWPDF